MTLGECHYQQIILNLEKFAATEELKFSRLCGSHAYGLRFFGYLPQGEEQADMLSLIQKQGFTTSFVF